MTTTTPPPGTILPDDYEPPSRRNRILLRAFTLLAVYAALALLVWILPGITDQFQRIVLTICAPAIMLSFTAGVYMIVVPERNKEQES
ncbi:MAG: hypothetical protein D6712_05710 [Chloroflexi bacterium]|nr:MAG: hypothetical protein D6712_05710 [Chloroflexota bacterium]